MNSEQKIDIISNLPLELVEEIFYRLDANATARVVKVSKSWKKMFENNFICNKLCEVNQVLQVEEKYQSTACKKFVKSFDCYHYAIWTYHLKLTQNWLEKPLGKLFRPNYKFSKFSGVDYLDEEIIVFTSEEWINMGVHLKFEVYNSQGKLIDQFGAGCCECSNISRQGDLIVIGIRDLLTIDCIILVRDINSKTFLFRHNFNTIRIPFYNYDNYTFLVAHDKDIIAANGREEHRISVICMKTKNVTLELRYDYNFLGLIRFYNEKLIVLTWNSNRADIHIVSFLDTYKKYMESSFQLNGAANRFGGAIMEGEYLIANINSNIYVCNINESKLLYVSELELNLRSLPMKNSKAFYLESNRCLKIIDYTNGNCIATINDEEDLYYEITANNKFFILASKQSEDSTTYKIKIFDILTNKLLRVLLLPIKILNISYLKATETMLLIGCTPDSNGDIDTRSHLNLVLDFDVY